MVVNDENARSHKYEIENSSNAFKTFPVISGEAFCIDTPKLSTDCSAHF